LGSRAERVPVECWAVDRKASRKRLHLGTRVREARRLRLELCGKHVYKRSHYFCSTMRRMKREETHAFRALSIPICSTSSVVSRKPAVSATTTGRPPISSDISKISRVVPGTWVTIAASRWAALSFVSAKAVYLLERRRR
jgi:hypothetical protein